MKQSVKTEADSRSGVAGGERIVRYRRRSPHAEKSRGKSILARTAQ